MKKETTKKTPKTPEKKDAKPMFTAYKPKKPITQEPKKKIMVD